MVTLAAGESPPEEPTTAIAVGGPYAGVWLEVHGPASALRLPHYVGEGAPAESHVYALSAWAFAGRKLRMYLHLPTQAEGEDAVNTALAEAVFHPEVFEQWKAAPRPEQLPEWAREH